MGASTLPWFMIDGEGWTRAGLSFTENSRQCVLIAASGVASSSMAVATDRRVLLVNDREWKPDVQSLPYVHGLVVKGWQDDRTASLIFEFEGRTTTIEQIGDRELAQRVAALVRTRVA